jgi:hypothetical protein
MKGKGGDGEGDSEYRDAYTNLSKTNLVQQSKIFNEKKLKDAECSDLLNKIIFLLNQVSLYVLITHRAMTSQRP